MPARKSDRTTVVLVSMPFGPVLTPSLGLGLLSAQLTRAKIANSTLYLGIPFARTIGIEIYQPIADGEIGTHLLVGDWLFRNAVFGAAPPREEDEYVAMALDDIWMRDPNGKRRWPSIDVFRHALERIRPHVEPFLSESLGEVLRRRPAIVGFTTVFQQTVASLALAQRIKQVSPTTRVIFGGANCEGGMGEQLLEQFDCIDAVVSGEGDDVIVPLVRGLFDGNLGPMLGVFSRNALPQAQRRAPVALDSLPYPQYDEYFVQLRLQMPELEQSVRLLYETGRGCWWGERHHCTFCGLNGQSMKFRRKSGERAYGELKWLTSAYPDKIVSATDNILDFRYFEDFIPRLAYEPLGASLFYEVKANLRKVQLKQLRQANVREIQPGIESLDDALLGLMRKGVSALQNVRLLKWCRELGIDPSWNILYGFPDEDPDAYERMARLIPFIRHLAPPAGFSPIRLDRFSPNFEEAQARGLRNVRPFAAYDYVYRTVAAPVRHKLAYFFDFEYADGRNPREYVAPLEAEVRAWQSDASSLAFFSTRCDQRIVLCDLRDSTRCIVSALDEVDSLLVEMCADGKTVAEVHTELREKVISKSEIALRLNGLTDSGVTLFLSGRYLSLPLDLSRCTPPVAALQRFQTYVTQHDESDTDEVSCIALRRHRAFPRPQSATA